MKKIVYLICLISIKVFSQESETSILEKTISNLFEIESVKHQSTFQSIESGMIYSSKTDTIFFDFTNRANSTPKYYFFADSETELIYDGKRIIQSLVNEKVILIGDSPDANNPLLLTLYAVKKFLPEMMVNDNIEFVRKQDTIINSQDLFVFDLTYKDGYIDWAKFELKNVPGAKTKYTLMIGMSDYLPRKMIMDNGPSGKMSRTYNNFDFDYAPDDKVWTGELLPEDYKKTTFTQYYENQKKKIQSLKGSSNQSEMVKVIENWKLPYLNKNSMADFSNLKGNLILLEFWFKNCGPCVQAVPKLNSIYQKYKNDNFQLFGIEYQEDFPQENLIEYVDKIKMAYPTLYKGKNIAASYGISAAPTFILINKQGDIIYSASGFNEDEIITLIETNL